jgi:hypothetical protein
MLSGVPPAASHERLVKKDLRCSALFLSALLLLFFNCARAGRYNLQNHNLKLATSLTYLVGDETRLETSIAALLLLWCISRIPLHLAGLATPARVVAAAANVGPAGASHRILHPRAPPHF